MNTNERSAESHKPIGTSARAILVACNLCSMFWATSAFAAVCVNTPTQLDAAPTVAESNGVDDDIRIVVGTSLLTTELVYFAVPSETGTLTISGGWVAGCLSQATTGETTLDGRNLLRPLTVFTKGLATIRRLDFVHGRPSGYGAADSASSVSTEPI
jgi:hypothetical protein